MQLDPGSLLPRDSRSAEEKKERPFMHDLALLYSKYDDPALRAVVEFVLTVREAKPASQAAAASGSKQEEEKKGGPASARKDNASTKKNSAEQLGSSPGVNQRQDTGNDSERARTDDKTLIKRLGIGWCIVQLFGLGPSPATSSRLFQGTPRSLLVSAD